MQEVIGTGPDAVLSQLAGDGGPVRPGRPEPDLAGVAVFTLDPAGRIASWSVTAARLFGWAADDVTGRDVGDVLLTGAGHQDLVAAAMAEVAAGRIWAATLAVASAPGDGQLAVQFEPLGPGGGALVIARQVASRPGPDLLREAAARVGTTLDLLRTAREFADVAVPAFADAATVFVSERLLTADEPSAQGPGPRAVVRRVAARVAGQPAAFTDSLLRPGEALVFSGDSPSYRAMTEGSPVVADRLDDETADRLARRPGGRQIAFGYASFLAVPLTARGVVLGCATFARTGGRGFSPADVTLATELAAFAAVCIDNARLYHRERRTAFVLQQGLLPAEPHMPDAVDVAYRYLPVGASIVGGDWHDIVSLSDGRAALIVGDAMGHGPEAAAVMVQLRTAAHALAALALPPEEVLRRLDRMTAAMPATPYATCICAVIDPAASSCVVASAGHPPPVLALPGGLTRVPDLPAGLPLGLAAGSGSFEATEISLPPGATLALFTDGLVKGRTRTLDDGLAALADTLGAALARAGNTLDSSCETVTQALRQSGEDDITLVLARIRP